LSVVKSYIRPPNMPTKFTVSYFLCCYAEWQGYLSLTFRKDRN